MALLFETKTKQSYNNVAVVYSLWSEMFAFFCKKKNVLDWPSAFRLALIASSYKLQ